MKEDCPHLAKEAIGTHLSKVQRLRLRERCEIADRLDRSINKAFVDCPSETIGRSAFVESVSIFWPSFFRLLIRASYTEETFSFLA